MSTNGHWYV
jgi:hypothetical protein